MIERELCGETVSMFGMGCMRLPVTDSADESSVDVEHANRMVAYAYENGCNYFDTAWGYHSERSETIIGDALSRYPRNSFKLTTKFPGYDSNNWGKHVEIFEQQLKKCKTDYFDFYLIHNVCEMNIDAYLDEERYGTRAYFTEQRRAGKIRHLGFSVHGSYDVMRRFLEQWGDDVEFVQIQLNYLDYTFQDAKAKLELAAKYDLPVIVMEPLRGGMLAKADEEEAKILAQSGTTMAPVGWSLRWLQGFDEVKVVLCGSSSLDQMKENMAYFEAPSPLNDQEREALQALVRHKLEGNIAPCTECRYCTSHCPQQIDIPFMLKLYDEHSFTGGGFIAPMALMAIEDGKKPQDCTACGSCAEVCPQQIDIPGTMAKFAKLLKG